MKRSLTCAAPTHASCCCFRPRFSWQTAFQTLFITAGRPGLGLAATVGGGLTNIVLDYVFIAHFHWGIAGAAIATGLGYLVPAVVGLFFFSCNRRGALSFSSARARTGACCCLPAPTAHPKWSPTSQTPSLTYLFNLIFLHYWGADGVASITIVLYFQFVFTAVFFGFSMGVAPVFSYKYGAQDTPQLPGLFRYCIGFVILCSVFCTVLSLVVIRPCLGR